MLRGRAVERAGAHGNLRTLALDKPHFSSWRSRPVSLEISTFIGMLKYGRSSGSGDVRRSCPGDAVAGRPPARKGRARGRAGGSDRRGGRRLGLEYFLSPERAGAGWHRRGPARSPVDRLCRRLRCALGPRALPHGGLLRWPPRDLLADPCRFSHCCPPKEVRP